MEVAGITDRLAERLAAVKAGKVGETLTDLKAALLVVRLAEMDAETAGKTLSALEAQELVDTFCGTISEVVANTLVHTLTYLKPEHRSKR